MRSRKTAHVIAATAAAGLLTVVGAPPALAVPGQVEPGAPPASGAAPPEPAETALGGLLNDLLTTAQDLLPGLLGGTVPEDPDSVEPADVEDPEFDPFAGREPGDLPPAALTASPLPGGVDPVRPPDLPPCPGDTGVTPPGDEPTGPGGPPGASTSPGDPAAAPPLPAAPTPPGDPTGPGVARPATPALPGLASTGSTEAAQPDPTACLPVDGPAVPGAGTPGPSGTTPGELPAPEPPARQPGPTP
ncbi:MAG TPA: hypothetical protein VM367_02075 [Pseudonocardia sp.]|jgi:hypothetical protein|nr:hypothetical protein [Pseudonocardia sp.]